MSDEDKDDKDKSLPAEFIGALDIGPLDNHNSLTYFVPEDGKEVEWLKDKLYKQLARIDDAAEQIKSEAEASGDSKQWEAYAKNESNLTTVLHKMFQEAKADKKEMKNLPEVGEDGKIYVNTVDMFDHLKRIIEEERAAKAKVINNEESSKKK